MSVGFLIVNYLQNSFKIDSRAFLVLAKEKKTKKNVMELLD